MTIIAYASGNNSVNNSPPINFTQAHDPVITMSNTSLPVAGVNLYGNAVDSEDATATFTYAWSILSQSHQSPAASFVSNTLQNPTVGAVSTWGNIRCFLVVTNISTQQTSETDPLKAPDSAFVTVRVKSTSAAIQKIAAGERNWNDDADAWVQAIEDISAGANGLPDHTILSHSDVSHAKGTDLDALVQGALAEDPDNAGNPLHLHRGTDVEEATGGVRGTVRVEVASATKKAINVEKLVLSASLNTTQTAGGVVVPSILPAPYGGDFSDNLATWHLQYAGMTIRKFFVTMGDGGPANPGAATKYRFDLVVGTAANFAAKAMARQNFDITGSPAADNAPFSCEKDNINVPIAKNSYIGFRCVNGPVAGKAGGILTVTVIIDREAQ